MKFKILFLDFQTMKKLEQILLCEKIVSFVTLDKLNHLLNSEM